MKEKLALVLGGGGALGAYQVGAIKALRELGFEFSIITGTSIGALNGAFLASGDEEAMYRLWRSISADQVYRGGLSFSLDQLLYNKYGYAFEDFLKLTANYVKNGLSVDITPFRELLKKSLDINRLRKSHVRFGLVTTEMRGLREVDIDIAAIPPEKILPYLHASSAIVPFFPPEEIDGRYYIDGFYSDNIPMRLAFRLGATRLIVVDVGFFAPRGNQQAFMSFRNVDYIAPFHQLGSMIDFEQNTIRKNIRRGYLDVMKHFGRYHGFYYAFRGKLPSRGFFQELNEHYGRNAVKVCEYLQKGIRADRPGDDDYFLAVLEMIMHGIGPGDDLRIYAFKEVKAMISDRLAPLLKVPGGERAARTEFRRLFVDRKNRFKSALRRDVIAFFIDRYVLPLPSGKDAVFK